MTTVVTDERVERIAEIFSDYVAWRRWDNMAEDKADLRMKMRGGDYDVNEPTKSDCREAARAAIQAIEIDEGLRSALERLCLAVKDLPEVSADVRAAHLAALAQLEALSSGEGVGG